ncbi:MAG: Kelch repeat-containing protein [Odoribacter splanchnicus]
MKVIFYILIFCLFLISCNDDEEKIIPSLVGEWEVADSYFYTNSNQGISFSIGDSLYMGLGIPFSFSYNSPNELRRYTKTSYGEAMKDFPGKPRIGAVAFTIKDKAYIGLGKSITDEKTYYKDFWVYDATSNSWDSLTFEFPGDAVVDAVAFSLNGMGYVGTGLKANGLYSGEFYQFDPQYGWGGMANMVLPRTGATTCQLNGTVYLCFGHNRDEDCRDVYRFDPKEFRFIPLNSLLPDKYPGITRSYASSFVLTVDGQEYAYIVGGDLGLSVAPPYWYCCRYNYLKDEWEETPSMPRSRSHVTAFAKDNAGYVCFDDIVYKFVP